MSAGLAILALLLGSFNTYQNWAQKKNSESMKLERILNDAWNAMNQDNFERARQELGLARALSEKHPRYLLYMGLLAQLTNRRDRARQYYDQALKARENYVPALCYMGVLCLEEGKVEEAESLLKKAESLSADADESNEAGRVFILLNLGSVLLSKRDLDSAKAVYQEGLQLDPENAKLHAGLGTYYASKGEMERAVTEYWEALQGDPKDAEILASLASTLYLMDDLPHAEIALRRSLDLEETSNGMKFLAIILEEQGRDEEAKQVRQRAERTQLSFSPEGLGELLGREQDREGEAQSAVD